MKKLIGYSLFCIGIGMLIMCFIESAFFKILLIGVRTRFLYAVRIFSVLLLTVSFPKQEAA